ncbi:unnamed protein product [Coffea canephora]|uniref:Strictosidine synthase conserved region domain-containing protein n=1 Tax=Coffea canephora TaxID=49390 RepID=A0A068UMQ3_COFCA|nr:unnamed protein product [Coffea canephora]
MNGKLFLATLAIVLIATLVSPRPEPDQQYHQHEQDGQSNQYEVLPILDAVGPESLAFDKHGEGPYTGVSDGRIIKWQRNENRWINFAVTTPHRHGCEGAQDHDDTEFRCGRTLGLSFNHKTGDLYIADAYMGLLVVGPKGGLATPLAKEAQGVPFKFTNGVVVDQRSGVVYFTDSSTKFQRKDYMSIIFSGDNSGRLMKFDPTAKKVTVLLHNLMFPNGVALSKNGDFLLITETTNCRVLKFWLDPSKAGGVEVFANLPGIPDNINRNQKGEFWVAINSRIGSFNKKQSSDLRGAHSSLANDYYGFGLALKLSKKGEVLEALEAKNGETWMYGSDIVEKNGYLWIGSVIVSFAFKLKISK